MPALYPDLRLLIGPDWVGGGGRAVRPVTNPATRAVLGELPVATADDIDRALRAAASGFPAWRRTSPFDRARVLRRGADLIRERQEAIATAMTLEQGKVLAESRREVAVAADLFDWFAEEGRRVDGRVIAGRGPHQRFLALKEPVGPVAAFTPWNFPATGPARKVAAALAAGCSVILKAAEETPATAILLAECLLDAGLPPCVLNLVFGEPAAISSQLIAAETIRKVSFTGSIPVGRHIARLAGDRAIPLTLELGGHAPVIVLADVDVEAVATQALAAKTRNAGQVCIAPTRFFVAREIHATFVDALAEKAARIVVGDGLAPDSQMGPLANPRRMEAMRTYTSDAVTQGARLVTGGAPDGPDGSFWRPTVLDAVPDAARIMREEPFGPVAVVQPVVDAADALRRANALPFGLAAYLFTRDGEAALRLADGIEAGLVGVNSFQVTLPETPFGGVKDSGYGSEGGREGLEAYCVTKCVSLT